MGALTYTDELAQRVLERITLGDSVLRIARDEGISEGTIRNWMLEGRGLFANSARARELGCDALADQCIEIADDKDMPSDQKRIRIDTRIRLLGKWSKRYGEKVSHDVTVRPANELSDDELARIAGGSGAAAPAVSAGLTD